jgi:cytochrome c oxidase subunit 1
MTDISKPNRLSLAHWWVAFATFFLAAILGTYQVLERAQMVPAWAEGYYISVTAHGVIMGFVLTTFFIVGFGYYIAATSLKRAIWAPGLAWLGFWMMLIGVLLAVYALVTGQATVMYTFYPPLTAHPTFYIGAALLVVGSIFWIAIMIVMTVQWKRDNPGQPLPLAQFANTTNALLWLWTLVGVAVEIIFQLIPLSLGWVDTVDVGLARTLFAWTLHPIVYFWLIPAYIALYLFVPKVAGGRLFSDEMARVAFVMLLVFSLPIGFHHLYVDPFQAAGWKLLHGFGTFMVAIPTLITGFAVIASMEIAGRLRGGKGLFGWIGALPWNEPMVLAGGLALLMLTVGGFGGVVNASYAMNTMVHNTMWVPAHFHLIFAGTTIIMYFAIAYYLWPKMTGRQLYSKGMANLQLWLWFIGILVLTLPWHLVGALWMPRRTAFMPYDPAYVSQWEPWTYIMGVGGVILAISSILLMWNLLASHGNSERETDREVGYAEAVYPVVSLPKALNGFALWNGVLVVYMAVSFGYPIAQFFIMDVRGALAWGW